MPSKWWKTVSFSHNNSPTGIAGHIQRKFHQIQLKDLPLSTAAWQMPLPLFFVAPKQLCIREITHQVFLKGEYCRCPWHETTQLYLLNTGVVIFWGSHEVGPPKSTWGPPMSTWGPLGGFGLCLVSMPAIPVQKVPKHQCIMEGKSDLHTATFVLMAWLLRVLVSKNRMILGRTRKLRKWAKIT